MKIGILKKTLGLLFAVGIAVTAMGAEVKAMENGREVMNFNSGWLYSPKDYSNAHLALFDDSGFERVSVPHANKVIEGHKGNDFMKHIESYRFASWYRRHFTLDESYSSKRILVKFEAVATVADVYVNGKSVGSHKGAYTGFTFDITDYISFAGDNVIAVRVDSSKRGDIPPEGGDVDYCLFGGIVRDVYMLAVEPLYVENVFISTPDLSAESGTVSAKALVRNSSGEDKLCTAETIVYDKDKNVAASCVSEEIRVMPWNTAELEAVTEKIPSPRLWSVDDPYLYTAKTVIKENGKIVDSIETKIGFRWFEFRSVPGDGSFYLNGEKLVLRGINRHEQWPWQGRAIPNKLQAQDAELLKATGFNAVRCSHYPQDPEFLDRCDELGLIVFEEAPGWQYVGDEAWQQIYKTNIEEMILRDRNHPSIVTWGVRVNESWDNHDLYTDTAALSKSLDPTRPTHGVRRNENYESTEMIEDIFGSNYQYPEEPRYTPFVSTEHSWECWTNGCGFPWASDAEAMEFTKSFANVVDYYYRNDLCAGGFGWSMFDYNNEVNYTNTGHVFYSGLYDLFRQPKPVAYFYKSQHLGEPMVYIANYWTETSSSEVQVYSSCDEVELFVNGVSKGRITPNLYVNVPHPAFSFSDIPFEAGELKAVGYVDGKAAAEAVRLTPGKAKRLVLTPDYTELIADGTDMTAVLVELVDENGTRLPYADNEVEISVEGAGVFIGEKNIALEGGRVGFFVRTQYLKEGTVVCTASAEGMESGKIEILVKPYDDSNAVPFSEGEGSVEPLPVSDVNDTEELFNYSEGWLYCTQKGCHGYDNHYSDGIGETVTVTFNGDMLEWYATKAPNHGIMAVSVDNGPESCVDCYSAYRADNVLLYSTGSLGKGEHTLKVRVTGKRNALASGSYINADFVRIYADGKALGSALAVNGFSDWILDEGMSRENGVLKQPDESRGDRMGRIDGQWKDYFVQASVSVPSQNDTGSGILARIEGDNRYYQLELKYENDGLIWAIWKNYDNAWTQLAGGPIELDTDAATLRLELDGEKISACILTEEGNRLVLGSCADSAFTCGGAGLRTHNTRGEFSDIAIWEIVNSTAFAALKDVRVKNGELTGIYVDGETDNLALIAAEYENGIMLRSKELETMDRYAPIENFFINGKNKLFVWNSLEDMKPMDEVHCF